VYLPCTFSLNNPLGAFSHKHPQANDLGSGALTHHSVLKKEQYNKFMDITVNKSNPTETLYYLRLFYVRCVDGLKYTGVHRLTSNGQHCQINLLTNGQYKLLSENMNIQYINKRLLIMSCV